MAALAVYAQGFDKIKPCGYHDLSSASTNVDPLFSYKAPQCTVSFAVSEGKNASCSTIDLVKVFQGRESLGVGALSSGATRRKKRMV